MTFADSISPTPGVHHRSKGDHPRPHHLGDLLDDRLAVVPAHFRHDLDGRPFDAGERKDRQVDQEFGERVVEITLAQEFLDLVLGDLGLVGGLLLGGVARGLQQGGAALAGVGRIGLLAGGLHDHLLLVRHQRVDLLDDLGRHGGIGGRADRPGLVGAEVDIAQQRGGGAAFLCGQPGVDLGAAELDDFLKFSGGILAVEGAQRLQQAVRPAGCGIAVIAEYLELTPDVACELGDGRLWRGERGGLGELLFAQVGFQRRRRHDLQDIGRPERIDSHAGV